MPSVNVAEPERLTDLTRRVSDPRQWTQMDVVHWLCWATNEFCMEGVEIDKFNMTGREMCAMGKDNFLARTPQWMGDILWEHLEKLQRGEYLPVLIACAFICQISRL